jgi:sulfonate transport system ATP-binding protein
LGKVKWTLINENDIKQGTPAGRPKLELEEISKSFFTNGKTLPVLEDVSLKVEENDLVCVLGESGCGKTTLLNIVAGLEKSTGGRVKLKGEVVKGPHFSRCLVFQKPALFPWLTVEKNVSLGLEIRGDVENKSERVAAAVRLVGLEGFEQYMPSNLSGGMAQRVALARSLVNRPEVLLLDEPFGALDAVTRGRMQDELLNIWDKERYTAMLVTHDIDEAIYIGTKIVVMTTRPGSVKKIFEVPLSRPRVRSSREFVGFRAEVSRLFFDQHRSVEN